MVANLLDKWFVRVLPVVEARFSCESTWMVETAHQEVHRWSMALNLVPPSIRNGNHAPPMPPHVPD